MLPAAKSVDTDVWRQRGADSRVNITEVARYRIQGGLGGKLHFENETDLQGNNKTRVPGFQRRLSPSAASEYNAPPGGRRTHK